MALARVIVSTPHRTPIMPYRTTARGEERRAAMRRRILSAARDLLRKQGYQATTTRQIVEAAGTSMGNLYFYFPTKEAILRALIEEGTRETAQAMDRAMQEVAPGPSQLATAIYVGVVALLEGADLTRVLFADAAQAGLRAEMIALAAARVRRFMEDNPSLLGGAPAELLSMAWQGSIWQVVETVLEANTPEDSDAVARFLARWNLQALGLPQDVVDEALAAIKIPSASRLF